MISRAQREARIGSDPPIGYGEWNGGKITLSDLQGEGGGLEKPTERRSSICSRNFRKISLLKKLVFKTSAKTVQSETKTPKKRCNERNHYYYYCLGSTLNERLNNEFNHFANGSPEMQPMGQQRQKLAHFHECTNGSDKITREISQFSQNTPRVFGRFTWIQTKLEQKRCQECRFMAFCKSVYCRLLGTKLTETAPIIYKGMV